MINRIAELLELYESSDNKKDFSNHKLEKGMILKRDLIEAKMHVDKWGNILTDWFFPTSMEQELKNIFANEVTASQSEISKALEVLAGFNFTNDLRPKGFKIWGANVHFVDELNDIAVGAALSKEDGTLMPDDGGKLSNSIIVLNLV